MVVVTAKVGAKLLVPFLAGLVGAHVGPFAQ